MTDKYKELREAIEQLKNKPSYEAVDRFRANSGITDIVALLAERDALRDALKEAKTHILEHGNERNMAPIINQIDAALGEEQQ